MPFSLSSLSIYLFFRQLLIGVLDFSFFGLGGGIFSFFMGAVVICLVLSARHVHSFVRCVIRTLVIFWRINSLIEKDCYTTRTNITMVYQKIHLRTYTCNIGTSEHQKKETSSSKLLFLLSSTNSIILFQLVLRRSWNTQYSIYSAIPFWSAR